MTLVRHTCGWTRSRQATIRRSALSHELSNRKGRFLTATSRALSVYDNDSPCTGRFWQTWIEVMSGFKDRGFRERLSTASNAKRATTTNFLQRPGLDDPAVIRRKAGRVAVSDARDARRAERDARRLADEVRITAEREAHARAAAEKKAAEEERTAAESAQSDAARMIEQKAARDARYAARKARK